MSMANSGTSEDLSSSSQGFDRPIPTSVEHSCRLDTYLMVNGKLTQPGQRVTDVIEYIQKAGDDEQDDALMYRGVTM